MSKESSTVTKVDVWYADIKNCIFGSEINIKDISFLKVFFAPAFYSYYLCEYGKSTSEDFNETDFEDLFYCWDPKKKSYSDLLEFGNEVSTLKLTGSIVQLTGSVLDMVDAIADSILTNYNECSWVDDQKHIRAVHHPENYDSGLVFKEFYRHRDFYIEYLKIILKCLELGNEFIDTDKMLQKIHNLLIEEKGFGLNIPYRDEKNIDNTYYNIAACLYNYILICTEPEYKIEYLSRFRAGVRSNVQTELCNYASVIEHYPMNSIDRLAALRELAEHGNLYATQDLYFIYSHDITLYSADGVNQYFMKSDMKEAEKYYQKIYDSNERECFHNVFFHHDKDYISDKFIPSLVKKYSMEYKTYSRKQIEEMMKHLAKIYESGLYPVSLDLIFFMKKVFEEKKFLKELQELEICRLKIHIYLLSNQWTEKFELPDEDKLPDKIKINISDFCNLINNTVDIPLQDVLFNIIKYVSKADDDELEAVCKVLAHNDMNILEDALSTVKKKYSECNDKLFDMNDGPEKDELEVDQRIWKKIGVIIRKVIE